MLTIELNKDLILTTNVIWVINLYYLDIYIFFSNFKSLLKIIKKNKRLKMRLTCMILALHRIKNKDSPAKKISKKPKQTFKNSPTY